MDNSFIYTICSEEVISANNDPIEYNLNFGGFGSQYDNFKVEIIGFDFNSNFDYTNDKYLLVAFDNLASSGVFSRSIIGSRSVLIPVTIVDPLSARYLANGNIFFNVDRCRIPREIKMRILSSDLKTVSVDPTNGADWFLTMKVTPIE